MTRRGATCGALAALVLSLPISGAVAADCEGIDAKIAAAKTSADHEAIAACFDEMAKSASEKAAEHKKMGAAYRKEGKGLAAKLDLPQHCVRLTNGFTQEAKAYAELAKAHRAMAKGAK